jgi:hypothetical protein
MHTILLFLHNTLRWLFLLAAVYAVVRAISGLRGNTVFGKADNTAATLLLAFAHTQLLIGLVLWFTSPTIQALLQDVGSAMKDKTSRIQLVEHPLTMIIAVALIQIGRIRAKKAYADIEKHRRSLIFYGLGLLLVLIRIPWSSTPLFRSL